MEFFGRHQGEAFLKIETHLIAEYTACSRSCSVCLFYTRRVHVSEQVQILFHELSLLKLNLTKILVFITFEYHIFSTTHNTKKNMYFCTIIMNKKVAFYTLGCKLNFSETSSIGRIFKDAGYEATPFHSQADVYVINTCSVTDHADKKCRKVVKEALKYSPHAYITIVGCYAQLKPKEIADIPGVDMVLGAAEKFNIIDHINDLTKQEKAIIRNSPITETNQFVPAFSIGDRTRTFLKVQDGCDYSCTFCTIPLARGASRSGKIEDIVQQARDIAASGVKEIVLTGVNI